MEDMNTEKSKAVLVMNMPESCRFCRLRYDYRCFAENGHRIMDKDSKPDWCPLREFPEKKEEAKEPLATRLYRAEGWNDCLDVITGGTDDRT